MASLENIHRMNPTQRASWITRKLVVHKNFLPSRELISRQELKKKLLNELESFIPDEESLLQSPKIKKRKVSYNELVDDSFQQYLKQLTRELSPNDEHKDNESQMEDETEDEEIIDEIIDEPMRNTNEDEELSQPMSDTNEEEEKEEAEKEAEKEAEEEEAEEETEIVIDEPVQEKAPTRVEKESEKQQENQNKKETKNEETSAQVRQRMEENGRSFCHYMQFRKQSGKIIRYVKMGKYGNFPVGKTQLVRDGKAFRTIENIIIDNRKERGYEAPDLQDEKDSIFVNIFQTINDYVKSETAQALFNYSDSSRLTSCEECLLQLGRYYHFNFILEPTDSIDIKSLWSQLHDILLQGGMTQVSIPHLNMQFIFFIFHSHVKQCADGSELNYSDLVVACSRLLLADTIHQELNRVAVGSSLSTIALDDNYGDALARYVNSSELKNMIVACYNLFVLTNNVILLHMSFRLVTLVQRMLIDETQLGDAIVTCVNLIDLYSSIDVNMDFDHPFEHKIMQKFSDGLMADAVYTLLSNKKLSQGIQTMRFFMVKKDQLRCRFFSEEDNILFRLLRHIVDLISMDPSKFISFVTPVCRVLFDDVKAVITASSSSKPTASTSSYAMISSKLRSVDPTAALEVQKCQTHAMFMLCHAMSQGIGKYIDANREDAELTQSAHVLHVLLLKNVFNFMLDKGFNYVDEVVEHFIDEKILNVFMEPLANLQPSELANNILWPQTLLLLSSVIRVDHMPFFKRLESFWLVLMGICSSVLSTTEFETLNQTLDVVFSIIFAHRFTLPATEQYFNALDEYIVKCENIEDTFPYSMAWYPPVRKFLKEAILSLATTQIMEYFEFLVVSIQSRIEVEDVLQKPQFLELLLFPLITFAFNVSINESNFHALQLLAKKIDVEIVAPLMDYGLTSVKNKKDDAVFTIALKLHYALTVLIRRTREFSSDIYTYKPVIVDENLDKEDFLLDFRSEGINSESTTKGYKLSDIGGMKPKELFKRISFTSRSIICYMLFERISLFYQQIMIMRHNYLQTSEEQNQDEKKILQFLEYNLQNYFLFLKDEFIKNAKKHASATEVWNGEVDLVTNNETYVVMLWFLITNNLSQFIQFLEPNDLKTILNFMISQLAENQGNVDISKGHTLYTITKRVWGSSLLEWIDFEKPRNTLFEIFRDRLEKNIKSLQRDKHVCSLLKRIKGYPTFDKTKAIEKYTRNDKQLTKAKISVLEAIKIRKAMEKVIKRSSNKAYKNSSVLQSSTKSLAPCKHSFNYLPLILELPCDATSTYFDQKQNFVLCALAVVVDLVTTLNNVSVDRLPLRSTITLMLNLPMNQKHAGLLFNKGLFTLQMQHLQDEETMKMQTKLFSLRLLVPLQDESDAEDVLQLMLTNCQVDNEEQTTQRMALMSLIFRETLEICEKTYVDKRNAFAASHSVKTIRRGLFYGKGTEENQQSSAFFDFETYWLTQLSQQTGVDLALSDLQACHLSQVVLLCVQLSDVHNFNNLNSDLWSFLLYQCKIHLSKLLNGIHLVSANTEAFITNILQASLYCTRCRDDDKLLFMKKPLADFLEPSFSALLSLLRAKHQLGENTDESILTRALNASTFAHKAFMIKFILRGLQSVASGQIFHESIGAVISSHVSALQHIFEQTKDTHITGMFESTILNVFNDLLLTCRSKGFSDGHDWIVPMVTFVAEISLGPLDLQKAHFLFNITDNVVDVLHDICVNCRQNETPSPVSISYNLWTIFDITCDLLQRLLTKKLIQHGQIVALIELVKKILVILLEQQFVKFYAPTDLDYYLEGVQVAIDKVKVLYNSLADSKVGEFMDQIVFDIIQLISRYSATLPLTQNSGVDENENILLAARRRAINWLLSAGSEVEGTLVTLFHGGFNPLVKLHLPKRIGDDPASTKIFAGLCFNQKQSNKK